MTDPDDPSDSQQQLARITLAIVTMRAHTPDDSHFADHYGDTFADLATEAIGVAGDEVAERLFLNMLDVTNYFLRQLTTATGTDASYWLRELSLDIEGWSDDSATDDAP